MIRLKTLKLKNFQAHKDSELEFHKYLNVIVGENNQGKSSILRALIKLLRNTPLGFEFVNWDNKEEECVIELLSSTDIPVKRQIKLRKHKKDDDYSFKHDFYTVGKGKHPEIYTNFGKKIPKEILNALGLQDAIDIDSRISMDISIQKQIDTMFMVQELPSVRAKIINTIAGLDVIENAAKAIKVKFKTNRTLVKTATEDKTQYEKDLVVLKDKLKYSDVVGKMRASLDIVETTQRTMDELVDTENALETIDSRADKIIGKKAGYKRVMSIIDKGVDKIQQKVDRLDELYTMQDDMYTVQESIKRLDVRIEDEMVDIEEGKKGIVGAEFYMKELLEEIEICPWCHTELDEEGLQHIIEEA